MNTKTTARTIWTAEELDTLDWEIAGVPEAPQDDEAREVKQAWNRKVTELFQQANGVVLEGEALRYFLSAAEVFYDTNL